MAFRHYFNPEHRNFGKMTRMISGLAGYFLQVSILAAIFVFILWTFDWDVSRRLVGACLVLSIITLSSD